VMALMTGVISPGKAFLEWGWRVPFLLSVVLIVIGFFVRRAVEESPVFAELAERGRQVKVPIVQLFRKHWHLVILAALVFVGNNAAGYMTTGGFIQGYATGKLKMDATAVLVATTVGAAMWFVATWVSGILADTIGRKKTYLIGFVLQGLMVFPLFFFVNTGTLGGLYVGLILFSIGLGLTYGPQAAWYSEIFPASVRFSGVSISYAIGAIIGGAFAPTIAQAIFQSTGSTNGITWYLAGMTLLGLVATLLLRDRTGIPLGPDHEAEQEVSPIRGFAKV
jgi:MFS family permease